jgi:hypothetical protein
MAAVVAPFPTNFHARKTRSAPVIPAGRDERYAAGKALPPAGSARAAR